MSKFKLGDKAYLVTVHYINNKTFLNASIVNVKISAITKYIDGRISYMFEGSIPWITGLRDNQKLFKTSDAAEAYVKKIKKLAK
jgi:hypothetical protein